MHYLLDTFIISQGDSNISTFYDITCDKVYYVFVT